jgi:hypothetical protein
VSVSVPPVLIVTGPTVPWPPELTVTRELTVPAATNVPPEFTVTDEGGERTCHEKRQSRSVKFPEPLHCAQRC